MSDFPVDDFTLDQLEHALKGVYALDDKDQQVLRGADFSLSQYLDFLSGYDENLLETENDEWQDTPVMVYPKSLYSEHDVILALVLEIRRLRDEL